MAKTWATGNTVAAADLNRYELALPDNSAQAVGKGELVVNAKDHGADPTGAASSVSAINALLTAGAHVLVTGGTYLIDAPIQLQASGCRLTVDESATLQVPSGYTGDVIQIGGGSSSIRGAVVDGGGTIIEAGKTGGAATALGSWTAFHFIGATGVGTVGCRVEGPIVWWCDTVAKWESQSTGWVNSCQVDKVRAYYFRSLVKTIAPTSGVGYEQNTVKNVLGECSNSTQYGVESLYGKNWTFEDVAPFDFPVTAVGAQIESTALGIRIVGGFLGYNLTNAMTNSAAATELTVIDRYQPKPWIRKGTTASRPNAASVGAGFQYYDTTLSKPIWSDGTTWRDATGTTA